MPLINIQDLHVSFSDGRQRKHVVKSAHFQVNEGETFSLIGASGCGKSTILRVIAGLQREWQGQIDLLGSPLRPQNGSTAKSAAMCRWYFKIPMPRCILSIAYIVLWQNRCRFIANLT